MEENRPSLSLDDILNQELASFMNPEQEEFTYTNQAVIPEQPVTPDVIQALRQNPPYIQEMLQKIQDMDIYAQNRGTMGLDWGFQCLNEAFNGLNPGLHLVAGGANTGRDLTKQKIVFVKYCRLLWKPRL